MGNIDEKRENEVGGNWWEEKEREKGGIDAAKRRGGGEIDEKREREREGGNRWEEREREGGGIDEKINSRMRKVLNLTMVIKTIESVIWRKLWNLVDNVLHIPSPFKV